MCEFKVCIECKRIFDNNDYYFKRNPKSEDGFNKKCKECNYKRRVFADEGIKICSKCQRELPQNSDYYQKKFDTYDGFADRCKECCGYSFTDNLTKVAKEGFGFCIKCDRELPKNDRFFPKDKMCKSGFRNVCRECGKDGHFMPEDYVARKVWSKEENDLFKNRYPHYTNLELIELFYNDHSEKDLSDRAFRLGVVKSNETYIRARKIQAEKLYGVDSPIYGIKRSEETRKKISEAINRRYKEGGSWIKGTTKSEDMKRHISIIKSKLGRWKGNKNPRVAKPLTGELNPNWQGGITPIRFAIRNSEEYKSWRTELFIRDKHTCQRCGSKNKLEAHHIKCFSLYEEERFNLDNGLTLCRECHHSNIEGSLHYIYGNNNVTLENLRDYFTGVSWCIKNKRWIKEK